MIYSQLRIEVADFLGWTRSSANWTSDQSDRLTAAINAGYKRFVNSPLAPGETVVHRWSFLRPVGSLVTEADRYAYDLPATFAAMATDLVYDEGEDVHRVIKQTHPAMIDRNRAVDDSSGQPYLFALRPKSVDLTAEQTTELLLFPTPDAVYSLIYHYDAQAADLSDLNAYPLGGSAHSQTILQSCRDIAASWYKDDTGGKEHDAYLEFLKASIEADRRLSPETLGMNDDGQRTVYTRHGSEFSVSLSHNLGGG